MNDDELLRRINNLETTNAREQRIAAYIRELIDNDEDEDGIERSID